MDQEGFPGGQVPAFDHVMPDRKEVLGQGGCLRQTQAGRDRQHLSGGDRHILRVTPAVTERAHRGAQGGRGAGRVGVAVA